MTSTNTPEKESKKTNRLRKRLSKEMEKQQAAIAEKFERVSRMVAKEEMQELNKKIEELETRLIALENSLE